MPTSHSEHTAKSEPNYHRQIWMLTWPILLANLSTPLLGLVDTALLGQLGGSAELAAAAIGASIYSYVFWGFGFLRQGATGLTAQAYGRNDLATQQQLALKNLLLGAFLGCLLLLVSPILIPLALKAMAISEPLFNSSGEYLQIRFFAAPFMLATFGLLGWFIGRQQSRLVMWILVSTNLINILLDIWFINYLGWGSKGAAIASSLAEISGFCLAMVFLFREKIKFNLINIFQSSWRPLLKQNHFLFQRSLLLLFCFSVFTAQGEKFGAAFVAANVILFQLLLFVSYFLDAYAHTIEALVGESFQKIDLQKQWIKNAALWNFSTAFFICLGFLIFSQTIAQLFSSDEKVQQLILEFIPWLIILPPIAAICYFLDGIFIGLTEVKKMRNSMIFSCLAFLLCWYWWGRESNHGLWLAMLVLHLARDISMGWFYVGLRKTNQ